MELTFTLDLFLHRNERFLHNSDIHTRQSCNHEESSRWSQFESESSYIFTVHLSFRIFWITSGSMACVNGQHGVVHSCQVSKYSLFNTFINLWISIIFFFIKPVDLIKILSLWYHKGKAIERSDIAQKNNLCNFEKSQIIWFN